MTAHHGEMGCFTQVDEETVLALPTGVVTVKSVMLAMHGVLVAWASSDSSVLPAMPGSSPTTRAIETTSTEQHETSTTSSISTSPTLSATSTHTLTTTPTITSTGSTTERAESQISGPAGDETIVAQDTLTSEPSSGQPPTSVTYTSPSAPGSITPNSAGRLRPSAIQASASVPQPASQY